ncbi:hypothetical protein Mgra_00005570 [Meloidogyne graminicola]|uniref:Uncharacterized protein n=1 Tax=Meloidogyne graminicola TaxID=189291 RepID=A0A8S9ZNW3_9BILA|nr:hypothetical protein Mgra_00005570 [Meloidogyne graminicola]
MLIKILLIFLTTQIILLTKIQARNNKFIINIEHQKAKNFFVHNLTSNILKHIWKQNNSKNNICSILHGRDKPPTKDEINGNINITEEIKARIRTKVYMNFMQLTNTKLYDLEKDEIEYEGTGIKEIEEFLFKAKFNIPEIKEKKDRIWRARCAFDLFLLRIIVELYLALSETELNIIRNFNGELINYRLGGEEIINKINKWFDEFGILNKESYKLYENKYNGNIKIVLYNEEAKHRSCAYKLFVFRGFLEFALVMDQLINKTSSIKYGQIIKTR